MRPFQRWEEGSPVVYLAVRELVRELTCRIVVKLPRSVTSHYGTIAVNWCLRLKHTDRKCHRSLGDRQRREANDNGV
jgi:hypothetical protein